MKYIFRSYKLHWDKYIRKYHAEARSFLTMELL